MYSTTICSFFFLVTLLIASLAQTSHAVSIYQQGQIDKRLLKPLINVVYEGQAEGQTSEITVEEDNDIASNLNIDVNKLLGL